MNILYCGDKNIYDGLIISIYSLIKNVKDILHIYVLTVNTDVYDKKIVGLNDTQISQLDNLVKKTNPENFVKLIDITSLFNENVPMPNIATRFTPCCMLRLYADKLPELPSKILYLDNDVIIRKDCSNFYNFDISNYELAGVLDHYGKWFFKNNFFKLDYLNSGVLLLNLDKIRKTHLFENSLKRCMTKKMFMPDQSSINKLCSAKKIFPRRFNEQRKLHDDTVIQHFTTSFRFLPYFHKVTIKPWNIDKMHNILKLHEYDDILEFYLKFIKEYKI